MPAGEPDIGKPKRVIEFPRPEKIPFREPVKIPTKIPYAEPLPVRRESPVVREQLFSSYNCPICRRQLTEKETEMGIMLRCPKHGDFMFDEEFELFKVPIRLMT